MIVSADDDIRLIIYVLVKSIIHQIYFVLDDVFNRSLITVERIHLFTHRHVQY